MAVEPLSPDPSLFTARTTDMLRQGLFHLSESPAAQRMLTGTALSRRVAARFVAGDTLDDAIAAAYRINQAGMTVSLDYLGESVETREEAEAAAEVTVQTLERIAAEGVDGNISIKPTGMGLDIDPEFCRANVERILSRARELGGREGEIFVRLDMESSQHTDRTVSLVEALWARGYRNTGTVLQSYLRRTPADLERLLPLKSRIRLVKGAYKEPPGVAFPDKADVDRRFVEETRVLLERGSYPAIATHDETIIDATCRWAAEHGLPKSGFEFQMLYGIRRDLQQQLREQGYNVRVYIPFGGSWYPYLMRRMAERPANVLFIVGSLWREASLRGLVSRWRRAGTH